MMMMTMVRVRRMSVIVLVMLIGAALVLPTHAFWGSSDDSGDGQHGDHDDHDHDDDSHGAEHGDYSLVTCGSAIRLRHATSGFYLHSHGINYGSGSGQQSVTAFDGADDSNNLWTIRSPFGSQHGFCSVGTPVRCNSIVRLQHTTTRKFLHSHDHASPLTHRQEVSAYGENGQSDSGDNWRVQCVSSPDGSADWRVSNDFKVSFQHVDTGRLLFTRRVDMFDHSNCRGCPIIGQLEMSGHHSSMHDTNTQFGTTEQGVFFPKNEAKDV